MGGFWAWASGTVGVWGSSLISERKEKLDSLLKVVAEPLKKNQSQTDAQRKKDNKKDKMDLLIELKGKYGDWTYDLADLKNGSKVSSFRDKIREKAGVRKIQWKHIDLGRHGVVFNEYRHHQHQTPPQ